MPRFDSGSVFGRLLDWDRAGYCAVRPVEDVDSAREYIDGTMVLATTFEGGGDEARLLDCFTMRRGGARQPYRQILRIVEGVRGRMDMEIDVCPRFDYGEVRPWVRHHGMGLWTMIGGADGLVVWADVELQPSDEHNLRASFSVRAGARVRLSIQFVRPEEIDQDPPDLPTGPELDRRYDDTVKWWRRWSSKGHLDGPDGPAAIRSAIVLKAMSNAATGAFLAAPTTSLPEVIGGSRNWDYRYAWIRDSSFSVRSLAELGYQAEAEGFRRFVERSAAGSAEELQIMYGVGGERRLVEIELPLDGYRRSRPVRVGNRASRQVQLDVLGELLQLAWVWHQRGFSPDDDYWRFLVTLVNAAVERWPKPDRGIWEVRGTPKHFVHSKVLCWAAVERGLQLAKECERRAPVRAWQRARKQIRAAIESKGYDQKRGVFVRAFGSRDMDASLLLIPVVGFVEYRDERMVRTVDAIRDELDEGGGLLVRYRSKDGLPGKEGGFLACSFWLVECLVGQGRYQEARDVFDHASAAANDLGLFSEEYEVGRGEMLGNFPQALTHLSHAAAAVALAGTGPG